MTAATHTTPETTEDYEGHPYGWLSPGGKFYPCDWANHFHLAADIVEALMPKTADRLIETWKAFDDYLLKRGWIKVGSMVAYQYFIHWKPPTQKQIDVVWDICQARNLKMPDFDKG